MTTVPVDGLLLGLLAVVVSGAFFWALDWLERADLADQARERAELEADRRGEVGP